MVAVANAVAIAVYGMPVTRSVTASSRAADRPSPPRVSVTTQVGILGDRAGSGKSFVILSLVLDSLGQLPVAKDPTVTALVGGRIKLFQSKPLPKVCLALTVLVVPHTIFAQWLEYIQRFAPTLRAVGINCRKHLDRIRDVAQLQATDILVVTNSFFIEVACRMRHMEARVRRVVYDEADTLKMSNATGDVDAQFTWYVTASYSNLVHPRGNVHDRYLFIDDVIPTIPGVRSPGPVRDLFAMLGGRPDITSALIVRNAHDFVTQSANMQAPHMHRVRCRAPGSLRVLQGIVDAGVIECLNAGDVAGAIQHIDPSNRGSDEDHLVILLLDRMGRQARTLEARLGLVPSLDYDSPSEREAETTRLTRKLTDLGRTMASVKQRITTTDTCCICCDTITNKAVAKCCSNAFCFACISRWTTRSSTCPLCKARLPTSELLVVDAAAPPEGGAEASHDRSPQPPCPLLLHQHLDPDALAAVLQSRPAQQAKSKIKTLIEIVRSRRGSSSTAAAAPAKLLVFSSNDNTFVEVVNALDALGVRHAQLKGQGRTVSKTIDAYKTGDVDALLVNTAHYGSGLNLENTTDIVLFHKFDSDLEHQVIGRAMRIGRTTPLHVWYLLHDHEGGPIESA
jgi:hypothetical protein